MFTAPLKTRLYKIPYAHFSSGSALKLPRQMSWAFAMPRNG